MWRIIRKLIENVESKKLITRSELERRKENLVYSFLLSNYERALKGKVDFGAWWYASRDMERIKSTGQLDKAYHYYKLVLERRIQEEIGLCN